MILRNCKSFTFIHISLNNDALLLFREEYKNYLCFYIVIKSYFFFEIYMKLLFTSKRHNSELHKYLSYLEITETVIFIFVSAFLFEIFSFMIKK